VTILVTICDWVTCDAPDDAEICGQPSRFCIERPGYIPSESCEEHLAAQVATLLEGEDITASVTVHPGQGGMPAPCPRCTGLGDAHYLTCPTLRYVIAPPELPAPSLVSSYMPRWQPPEEWEADMPP